MPAYKTQLRDAKASELLEIASACPNSPRFLSLVNQAQRRLMRRGNWFSTEQLVKFCVYDRCLTLPAYVDTLLGLRACSCGVGGWNYGVWYPAEIDNHWYSIYGPSPRWRSSIVATDNGMAPTYATIASATGSPVRYYVTKRNDIGKTITLFGTQYGGQPLMEKDENDNWREGLTITAAAPFAQTSVNVTSVTSVVRQATEGLSYLYEVYDSTTNPVTMRALATYGPNETNPRYRRMNLANVCWNAGTCEDQYGRNISSFEALVKLAFVPLVNDWDFLLIDNMDALKFMIQAILREEAGAFQEAQAFIVKACTEMNFDDRNLLPLTQTTIEVQSGGRVHSMM